MDSTLTSFTDPPARCFTSLGRWMVHAAGALSGEVTDKKDKADGVQRLYVNRPGQNSIENAVLAGLMFVTVSGLTFVILGRQWGWPAALLSVIPVSFFALHLIAIAAAGFAGLIRIAGIEMKMSLSDQTGVQAILITTALCVAAWFSGDALLAGCAIPWLTAFFLNLAAWFLSVIRHLLAAL